MQAVLQVAAGGSAGKEIFYILNFKMPETATKGWRLETHETVASRRCSYT